ncbi:MAG: hypothetical protein ACOX7F_06750 [Eubacteriales bacterium]|jgi:hypothetical protein
MLEKRRFILGLLASMAVVLMGTLLIRDAEPVSTPTLPQMAVTQVGGYQLTLEKRDPAAEMAEPSEVGGAGFALLLIQALLTEGGEVG